MDVASVIKLHSLKPWYAIDVHENATKTESSVDHFKFSVNEEINSKIFLCQGGIIHLDLDCVALPINQITSKQSTLAQDIHRASGPALEDYYKNLKGVKTGNVVLDSGYDLPARYIIQVMEPGVHKKFQSAVESALHRSYRNAMQLAAENNLHSIAFIPLYESSNPAVKKNMAHIAISTVRRCLEQLSSNFNAVVFSVSKDELDLYLKLLPAYFPRSHKEASENSDILPPYDVGEWGERVDVERAIRITDLQITKTPSLSESASESATTSDCESNCDVASVHGPIATHSFASMSGDHDTKRMKQLKSMSDRKMKTAQERIYKRLLRLARTDDLSKVQCTKALFLCGEDRSGSRIAVLVSKYINVPSMDMDKALLYFIHTLDSIVNQKYSLVYFHTMSQSNNNPPMNFVKRVYNVLDKRYRENLNRLYIVHPSFWSRIFMWFFTTFTANDVKGQVTSIKSIPELYHYIAPDQIEIPPFVSDYDLKVNIEVYQKNPSFPGALAHEHFSEETPHYTEQL